MVDAIDALVLRMVDGPRIGAWRKKVGGCVLVGLPRWCLAGPGEGSLDKGSGGQLELWTAALEP